MCESGRPRRRSNPHGLVAALSQSDAELSTVWVSSHDGSDENPGVSPAAPLRSVAAGLRTVVRHDATALRIEGQHSLNETIRIADRTHGLLIDSWPGRPPPTLSGAAAVPLSAWVRDGDHFSASVDRRGPRVVERR